MTFLTKKSKPPRRSAGFAAILVLATLLGVAALAGGVWWLREQGEEELPAAFRGPVTALLYATPQGGEAVIRAQALEGQEEIEVARISGNSKDVQALSDGSFLYITDTDPYHTGERIVRLKKGAAEPEAILAASDNFRLESLVLSPLEDELSVWEVKVSNPDQPSFSGATFRVRRTHLASLTTTVVTTDEHEQDNPDDLVHYPLFFDSRGNLYLDTYAPAGGGWNHGISRVARGSSQLVPVLPLAKDLFSYDPTLSPDGGKVAYPAYNPAASRQLPERDPKTFRKAIVNPNQLVVLDLTTQTKTIVADPQDGTLYNDLKWTPDGKRLVYLKREVDDRGIPWQRGIEVVDFTTKTTTRLVTFDAQRFALYLLLDVSPKGDHVVYGEVELGTMNYLSPKRSIGTVSLLHTAPLSPFLTFSNSRPLTALAQTQNQSSGRHPIRTVSRTLTPASQDGDGRRPTLQLETFTPKLDPPQQIAVRQDVQQPVEQPQVQRIGCSGWLTLADAGWALGIDAPIMDTSDPELWEKMEKYAQEHGKCLDSPLYLYPSSPIKVTVKVGRPVFNSNLAYQDGWEVVALPNGTMITSAGLLDKITYDYAAPISIPQEGYVVPRTQLTDLLTTYATTLGLNPRESSDFISHWEKTVPTTYPYIFVSHYQGKDAQEILPLDIEPKPDTLLQLVMVFKPLSTIYTLPSKPILPFPPRAGFTAVEWSGVVIDK